MRNLLIYQIYFPAKSTKIRFPKTKWLLMVIIQELSKKKYRAVIKYWTKPSYRKDINFLKEILSKGRLTSFDTKMLLGTINYSHEINYPQWVVELEKKLRKDPNDYERIKVFIHEGKRYVIDGNHRLKSLNNVFNSNKLINVKLLTYKNESN